MLTFILSYISYAIESIVYAIGRGRSILWLFRSSDTSYFNLYFFVVRKQQRQPLVNNIHVCDDTEGVSTAVHVMSIVQSEGKFAACSRDPGSFY